MFKPVRVALIAALNQCLNQNQYADKVLQKSFKSNKKFGSRDRKEFAEAFYTIVRHYRLLEYLCGKDIDSQLDYYLENKETLFVS